MLKRPRATARFYVAALDEKRRLLTNHLKRRRSPSLPCRSLAPCQRRFAPRADCVTGLARRVTGRSS